MSLPTPLEPGGRPLVSVVIPTLDENADIAGCIQALGEQDHPLGAIEVILVDGCSADGTAAAAQMAADDFAFAAFTVVASPRRRTSISLNLGLEHARGAYVVRVDARARVPADYVRTCVEILDSEPTVGVVGGAQTPQARSTRLGDRGIARALNNRLATGLSRYRRSTTSGPADTVWMGAFRTADLRAVGGWPEDLAISEDWELNHRYRTSGAVVWFAAGLSSGYLPRTSFGRLARQYFAFGRGKGTSWVGGTRPEVRQVALVAGPLLGLVALLALVRRVGPAALFVAPAGYVVVDHLGSVRPGTLAERGASATAIAVFTGAWWVGVVVGGLGGVVHRSAVDASGQSAGVPSNIGSAPRTAPR